MGSLLEAWLGFRNLDEVNTFLGKVINGGMSQTGGQVSNDYVERDGDLFALWGRLDFLEQVLNTCHFVLLVDRHNATGVDTKTTTSIHTVQSIYLFIYIKFK